MIEVYISSKTKRAYPSGVISLFNSRLEPAGLAGGDSIEATSLGGPVKIQKSRVLDRLPKVNEVSKENE